MLGNYMIKNSKLNFNIKAILTALILLLTSFSVFAVADNQISYDQITVTYSFETPTIKEVTIGDGVYDRVTIQGLSASGNSGEPRLPVGGAYILLPQGTSLDDINVISESVFLGSGFNVEPVGQMIPISQISSAISPTPNENIYNSKDMFPGNLFEEVGTYSFRGYEMLVLNLHPIQYVPVTGELYFYEEMMISVNLVKDGNINPLFRDLEKDRIEIMNKVDNPEVVETYDYSIQHPLDSYDFLIITTDSLKNSFQPLENFHDANGISTIIKTTTDIGSSNPDDIRDYIRDAYNNWGIDYALIGADDDIIAAKDLFVRTIWWWPWSETEENMPSDLYYACLDGTYDYNGNGQFGEPDDGPGGGDVDLVAEVYVGRAPVGNTAEVNNFVDKTIAYLYSDDPYLEDVLMTGEELNDAPLTWGSLTINFVLFILKVVCQEVLTILKALIVLQNTSL